MFEHSRTAERAVLVHLDLHVENDREDLAELHELSRSSGAVVVAAITGTRQKPDPKYFVGSGKAEEIRACVKQEGAQIVLFNHALSPAQERNLERLVQCRVLDRTGLILDIFAQRASTYEGKLQVELAQLQHLSTRLVRGWTHLERQKGGIGLRGPGETQLETDRRLIGARIKQINKRLDKVRTQRDQGRKSRRKAELFTASLVGYTNTGKSTLFNRLTGAGVYAANQLFATLDPTLRRVDLPSRDSLILADTVGFIRHLPHDLVAAFRSTLEETRQANLLLHIIDAHDDNRHANVEQVNRVLKEIGADSVRQIEVYNKIDLLEQFEARLERDEQGRVQRVWLSAADGSGIELLQAALAEQIGEFVAARPEGDNDPDIATDWLGPGVRCGQNIRYSLCLPPSAGRLRARIFSLGKVLEERLNAEGEWLLEIELAPHSIAQLRDEEALVDRH